MRKWKRVNASDGIRLRSEMEPHEAALVQSMVTSMLAMLDERESSAPSDELAQLTGIRTGNTEAPPMSPWGGCYRTFTGRTRTAPAASKRSADSTAPYAACTSRRSSTPNARPGNGCCGRFPRTAGDSNCRNGRAGMVDRAQ